MRKLGSETFDCGQGLDRKYVSGHLCREEKIFVMQDLCCSTFTFTQDLRYEDKVCETFCLENVNRRGIGCMFLELSFM